MIRLLCKFCKLPFFTAFIRLKGKPFNCEDDISAYYEVKDCGEIDKLMSKRGKCSWHNGPGHSIYGYMAHCNEFNLQDHKVDKDWYGLPSWYVKAFAYVPRSRENCPTQVLYTRWDNNRSKVFMRGFSAFVNENGK